ncbi:hypothetical protein HII31_02591 [Pseudocercospora fuligena]|uniref:SnoaL-like domain-containing protein n=1 Tax=Pseudocercospora fuligena TaxID=685502 RepID=A0A8H6VRG6_9PEZI|nr:hypothetical protein HII31_02591 [Pseudocercospora fuligena]
MPITISDERVAQVTNVVRCWTKSFMPFDGENTPEILLSCFDPKVEWYDHGFHVVRVGHKAILGLHESFLHCNQPFQAEIKSLEVTATGAGVQQLWIGTCKNDIVRPDGKVVMKGSGRAFRNHVGFFLKIDDAGKITRIDEYDHRYWDEGKPEADYQRVEVGLKADL